MILEWRMNKQLYKITYSYNFSENMKMGKITFREALDKKGNKMYPIHVEFIIQKDKV